VSQVRRIARVVSTTRRQHPHGRLLLLLITLALQTACGGTGHPAAPAASGRPSTAPVPSASATRSVATADFSCRLPVNGFNSAPGGFVSFPADEYAPEAAQRLPSSQLLPDLGISYDAQARRWLPVRRQQVSADGRLYAYTDFPNRPDGPPTSDGVHVVDAATGREHLRIPNRPDPALPWFVAGFDGASLYLWGREPWTGGHPQSVPVGLAEADPVTGRVRRITDAGSWIYVGAGAAWGMDGSADDPTYGRGRRLLRLDLHSASQQTWLTADAALQLVGVDASGHPLVELNSDSAGKAVATPKLWLVPAPGQLVELRATGGLSPPELTEVGSVLEDGHGIWMMPPQPELWLYRPSTGLQLMHRFDDGITRTIAGGCS